MKTYSVRLPITTIAKLEELHRHLKTQYPRTWASKQELLFDLLEHAIDNWIEEELDQEVARSMIQKAAARALQLRASRFNSDNENLAESI